MKTTPVTAAGGITNRTMALTTGVVTRGCMKIMEDTKDATTEFIMRAIGIMVMDRGTMEIANDMIIMECSRDK